MNKISFCYTNTVFSYDLAFSASHALHFNACQQKTHVTSHYNNQGITCSHDLEEKELTPS
jgi:hypothetical protein